MSEFYLTFMRKSNRHHWRLMARSNQLDHLAWVVYHCQKDGNNTIPPWQIGIRREPDPGPVLLQEETYTRKPNTSMIIPPNLPNDMPDAIAIITALLT